jgi:hypothetical protein
MIGRPAMLAIGIGAALGATALYHGPIGKAEGFAAKIEREARAELERQEMVQIQARLEREPLRRTLILSGPADDFQREELPKIMAGIAGVERVRWDPTSLPVESAR